MSGKTSPYENFLELEQLRRSWCEETEPECTFCARVVGQVFCRSCGHIFKGRVSIPCSVHPKVTFLMDYRYCPKCQASSLKEIRGKN